jgi:hypothetical protein
MRGEKVTDRTTPRVQGASVWCIARSTAALKRGCSTLKGRVSSGNKTTPVTEEGKERHQKKNKISLRWYIHEQSQPLQIQIHYLRCDTKPPMTACMIYPKAKPTNVRTVYRTCGIRNCTTGKRLRSEVGQGMRLFLKQVPQSEKLGVQLQACII